MICSLLAIRQDRVGRDGPAQQNIKCKSSVCIKAMVLLVKSAISFLNMKTDSRSLHVFCPFRVCLQENSIQED